MRNFKTNLVKGLGFLMLATILQTYVCSGLCVSEIYMCCNESGETMQDCCKPQNAENNNSEKSDCQKEHLAFFQTIGQFHSIDAVQIFQPQFNSDLIFTAIADFNIDISQTEIAFFTGFHPPPPKDGISVFVQTFLI